MTSPRRLLSRLAHDALRHARPTHEALAGMTVCLARTEDETLVIDVQDPRPDVPLSQAAIAGEKGRGLKYARFLGAAVSRFLSGDMRFKTAALLAYAPRCTEDSRLPGRNRETVRRRLRRTVTKDRALRSA